MREIRNSWFVVSVLLIALAATIHAVNVRAADPQYQLVENWAQLPQGVKWGTMSAVDIDSRGTIYAFQRGETSMIMALDSQGKFLRSWGDKTFPSAHGLRVDKNGFVWVTDRGLHQVLKFSPDGKLLMALGQKGVIGDNQSKDALNGPSDVVIADNGDIFVSDGESTNTRIVKFSKDGKLIKFWGTKGSAPGELDVPHNIVMDSRGRLYVADRSNNRVQIFDQEGKYLDQMTQVGTPYGMFMTKDDVLYVVDGTEKNSMVIINTKDGKVLDRIEGLNTPHWVAVDSSGAVYVAETRGQAVKKFVKK